MRQPDEAILLDMLMFSRRIRDKVQSVTRAEFDADEDLQLALTHLIQIVGEAASRTTQSLRSTYPEVPWAQVIGMRHRIVHDLPSRPGRCRVGDCDGRHSSADSDSRAAHPRGTAGDGMTLALATMWAQQPSASAVRQIRRSVPKPV